ncbi:unnamed protein product [Macrosiphum euphorbiae]|uniref:Uncharacterized protein n=1 Tax=Macrosiphum euphorbiae TaxID=13131 RepID=A0AAV0WMA3_9HEMI|nr:unnamed protein product [Macrosiphum euphorbiae]
MSPRKERRCPGNISLKMVSERREVCAVAPSCWNQTSLWFLVKTAACLSSERLGDCWIDALTRATLSGVVAVKGRPDDFLFSAEPVALKFDNQT